MSDNKNGKNARRGIWAYTFDEALEVILLIEWATRQSFDEERQISSEETVLSAYGNRPIPIAIRHHMQQLLAVKIGSVFGKRGGGSKEDRKQVYENADLGKTWWEPMKAFADSTVENSQDVRSLLNRLKADRNQMIAHRDGKTADATHESERTLIFRADPTPLTIAELNALGKYIKACKYFCEHATDSDTSPKLSNVAQMAWSNA